MGESVVEAKVIQWLKSVGDIVVADDAIVEVATDKVDSEVSAEFEGVLVEIFTPEDTVIKVGEVMAVIETNAPIDEFTNESSSKAEETVADLEAEIASVTKEFTASKITTDTTEKIDISLQGFLSPLVKSIITAEKITQQELDTIKKTGARGRITKIDLKRYLKTRPKKTTVVKTNPTTEKTTPKRMVLSHTEEDELITLSRMGKMIADHMLHSKEKAAHVQSFIEVDVTEIVNWRTQNKDIFLKKTGQKLTFTPIFLMAVAKAIADNPLINLSFDGVDKVVKHKNINIGIAAALPDGNLIVPVIQKANTLDLVAMATAVNDLATRSKKGALLPNEVMNGTYTVTNVGAFGTVIGTPIINQPQSAILALGAIRKMPRVITTDGKDTIAVRSVMYLSHSYDHRVINGALGGIFIKDIKDYLESWVNTSAFLYD